jgi:hypothetical protein
MNYVYYGVFFVFSIFIALFLMSLLRKYISVTTIILQMRERNRAKLVQVYMKSLEGVIPLRGMRKHKMHQKEFISYCDAYLKCNSSLGNHSLRWLGVRVAFFNCVLIFICMILPYLAVRYSSFFGQDDKSWKIPLGITWSYKVVVRINSLIASITTIANDLLSSKRLEEYYDIKDEYD